VSNIKGPGHRNTSKAIPTGVSVQSPCAVDLDMSLMTMPPGQKRQLKRQMEKAFGVFTKHIDFLHRQMFKLNEQNDALEARLKALEPEPAPEEAVEDSHD